MQLPRPCRARSRGSRHLQRLPCQLPTDWSSRPAGREPESAWKSVPAAEAWAGMRDREHFRRALPIPAFLQAPFQAEHRDAKLRGRGCPYRPRLCRVYRELACAPFLRRVLRQSFRLHCKEAPAQILSFDAPIDALHAESLSAKEMRLSCEHNFLLTHTAQPLSLILRESSNGGPLVCFVCTRCAANPLRHFSAG